MRTSSARQLEFEEFLDPSAQGGASGSSARRVSGDAPPQLDGASIGAFEVPDFRAPPSLYAATSRMAARLNASSISEAEYESLLEQRQRLLDKIVDGTIDRRERHKLEYVRWTLDRVDDARYGAALDVLEDQVGRYEKFSSDLKDLYRQMEFHSRRK